MKKEILILRISCVAFAVIIITACVLLFPKFIDFYPQQEPTVNVFRYLFMIGIYMQSVLIIYILFQVWVILKYLEQHTFFEYKSPKRINHIIISLWIISILYVLIMPLVVYVADVDDAPGLIIIGLFFVGVSLASIAFVSLIRKTLIQVLKKMNISLK